jgi:hypothetical protein
MANRGYDSAVNRLNCEGGSTGTQRQRPSEPTGEPMTKGEFVAHAETRGGQYRRGGWDKYEMPVGGDHPVDPNDLPEFYARGGNADAHLPADYPGGTTA